MGQIGEIRDAEGVTPIDIADLEEDLRQGRISAAFALRYGPWTGDEFRRLREIPQLRDALDSPNACFAQNLRNPPFPRSSTSLSVLVLVAGLVNLWLLFRGWKINAIEESLLGRYHGSMTGFESVILDGKWWTPWSSQLVHAGPGHFLPNFAVIAYGGYRVERAIGATGFLVASAAAVSLGGLFVALFSGLPVMGSSILGYGYLGALLTIGFRFGDTIPQAHRRFYGYGNLLLFALLFSSGLRMEQASHLGHMGGLLGGILSASLLTPAICFRQPKRNIQRRKNLLWTVGLSVAPLVWVPVARLTPDVSFGGGQRLVLESAGVEFELPDRLSRFGGRLRGLEAWALGPNSDEASFLNLETLPEAKSMDSTTLGAFWSQGGKLELRILDAPSPLGEGWESFAMEIREQSGPAYRVVEHHLQRGQWLLRAGYRIRVGSAASTAAREALFGRFLGSIEVGEPPALRASRQAWGLKKSTQNVLDYADQLKRVGDHSALEEILAQAVEKGPPARRNARRRWHRILRERLTLWRARPHLSSASGSDFVRMALREVPQDTGVQREGILWLAGQGACEEAKIAFSAFQTLRPTASAASGIDEGLKELCRGMEFRVDHP